MNATIYVKPENGQKIGRDQSLYQYLDREMQDISRTIALIANTSKILLKIIHKRMEFKEDFLTISRISESTRNTTPHC